MDFQYWPQKLGSFELNAGNGNRIYSSVVLDKLNSLPDHSIDFDEMNLDYFKDVYLNIFHNIEPVNATNQSVYWESSETSVAEVDTNGKVTIKTTGTTIITCRTDDGGFTATCSITVEQGEIADSLAINFDARGKVGLSTKNLVDSVTGAYINGTVF